MNKYDNLSEPVYGQLTIYDGKNIMTKKGDLQIQVAENGDFLVYIDKILLIKFDILYQREE